MLQWPTNEEMAKESLDPLARKELEQRTIEWQDKVVTEAARLAAGRPAGYQREPVTPHDIACAVDNVNGLPPVPGLPRLAIVFSVASYFLAIVAGYFINNIYTPWGSVGFAITAVSGVLTFYCGEQAKKNVRR